MQPEFNPSTSFGLFRLAIIQGAGQYLQVNSAESRGSSRVQSKIRSLHEAVMEFVHDGDTIFVGGVGQYLPFAIGHEIVRQGRRRLTLCRSGADILFDMLVAAGCVEKLIF